MAQIPNDVIKAIRDQADIVSIIHDYVPLTKRGVNYTCSCPFHEDRSPSFSVSPSRQIFKCFSCGRAGNVFRFIEEIEGVSFVEAVQKVAEKTNIVLEAQYMGVQQEQQPYQRLIDIHQKTSHFYQYVLHETVSGENALSYLNKRGFHQEILQQFSVGLAPENSAILVQHLLQEGYTSEELLDSGIFYNNARQELVDRFAGRIMFPLTNRKGQVVAFSGRVYDSFHPENTGKYVNSPETSIFHKSKLIFNEANARLAIRQKQQVLVCEGYMDVIALVAAGFPNAVATMGTSLTSDHLQQLAKISQEIVFVFDGDEAGQKATVRAFDMSVTLENKVVKAVNIPQGLDPDEWIKQRGVASFKRLIQQAQPQFEFMKHYWQQMLDMTNAQQRAQYVQEIIQYIAKIPSAIEQDIRLQELSVEQSIELALLKEQLVKFSYQQGNKTKSRNTVKKVEPVLPILADTSYPIKSEKAYYSERLLLAYLVYEEAAWQYLTQLTTPLVFVHEVAQNIYYYLTQLYYDQANPLPLIDILNMNVDETEQQYTSSLVWDFANVTYSDQAMSDCIQNILIVHLLVCKSMS